MIEGASRTQPFLDNNHHFDFENSKLRNYRDKSIESDGFYKWSKDHMYRTSYVGAYSNKPGEPKTLAMPKYQGYIPYIVSENLHGKGFTSLTKDCFTNDKFGKNTFGLSSTGHNFKYEAMLDPSMSATSAKYGKSVIQRSHPAWSVEKPISTTHDFYRDPNKIGNPTFKETERFLQTQKKFTKTSGFSQNNDPFEGMGWNPYPALDGRKDMTEYRKKFNDDKAFHRNSSINKTRTLPKKLVNVKAD